MVPLYRETLAFLGLAVLARVPLLGHLRTPFSNGSGRFLQLYRLDRNGEQELGGLASSAA
jgi:hypothetical protein